MKSFLLVSIFIVGLQAASSFAQTDVRTSSNNLRNQFHRNLVGQCSTSNIDCGPHTAAPSTGSLTSLTNGPPSGQRIGAGVDGEVRCVSSDFGTAGGNRAGLTASAGNHLCLTTAGILWAGERRFMNAGEIENTTQFNNSRFTFTGFPRIPTGADTQFGVGAKSINGLDIGGTENDSPVPSGSSTGLINYTIRHDIKDSLTGGDFADCGNFDQSCRTAYKITWSAAKPSNCTTSTTPTCLNDPITGNGFESVSIPCPTGVTGPCREHQIRYGFTQRWTGAVTQNEGNSDKDRGAGEGMQEHIVSYSIVSKTNGNGDLISNPTGFYFVQMACLSSNSDSFRDCADREETNIDLVGNNSNRFIGFSETGSFSTAVSISSGIPSINVTLTRGGGATGSGCQHDSSSSGSCIDRVAPSGGNPEPFLP